MLEFWHDVEGFLLAQLEIVINQLACLYIDDTLHEPVAIPSQLNFQVLIRMVFLPLCKLQVYVIISEKPQRFNAKIFVLNLQAIYGIIIIQILCKKPS